MPISGLTVSELEQDRAALQQAWTVLAPDIKQAQEIKDSSVRHPGLLDNSRNQALLRWLDQYGREILALKTLYDAEVDPSYTLRPDNLHAARRGAEKLLDALKEELQRTGAP